MRVLLIIAFALASTGAFAQNGQGRSGDASKCSIAKCIETQKGRGYTEAQAKNWCPKNLHKGCI